MTFAEQLVLLALDPESGKFRALPDNSLEIGLAGAFLLELTFRGAVDTDLERVIIRQPAVPQRPLLDAALQVVCAGGEDVSPQKAIARLALQAPRLLDKTLQRLVDRGAVERRDRQFFFRRKQTQFPRVDARPYQDVVARVRELVLDPEAIPSPEEVATLALVDACRLQRVLFSERERAVNEARIQLLAGMDLVGRAVVETVRAARGKDLLRLASQ